MRVLVFTNNAPRHVSFVERVADAFDDVFVIQECNTLFPGKVEDFYRKSDTMQRYFAHVLDAEREVFGEPRFMPRGIRSIALHYGDVSMLEPTFVEEGLKADAYVVFGASYIKGQVIETLVERKAINIHMGVAPYYRGHSSNFWALYDRRPDLVGATIHHLSRGLDSGPILMHAVPEASQCDPFVFGMRAVKAAHAAVVEAIRNGMLLGNDPTAQDKSREMRYTRGADFSDAVAEEYLANLPSPEEVLRGASGRDLSMLIKPFVG